MKARTIGYWATTGLLALAFTAGGIFDLSGAPQVVATLAHLGYPAYLGTLLGAWKLLGAVALLAPRFPRVKEWAYAGIVFDLTGAVVSHLAVGDGPGNVIAPLVLLGLAAGSWLLRPGDRFLAAPRAAGGTEDAPARVHSPGLV